jgi:cell division transport system ATP-binding protein
MSTDSALREEIGPPAQPVARFDGVSLIRNQRAPVLDGASFALAPGSLHLLTGRAGAGKTSLLRLLALAEPPTSGVVQIFGRDVLTLSDREAMAWRRRIGAVLQPLVFLDHLSVWDNAALALLALGRHRKAYGPDVDEALRWTGLEKFAASAPADLPAAERHRLAIARAVVSGPELVLIDEPEAALDAADGARLLRLVTALAGAGAAVVMAVGEEATFAPDLPRLRLQGGRVLVARQDAR